MAKIQSPGEDCKRIPTEWHAQIAGQRAQGLGDEDGLASLTPVMGPEGSTAQWASPHSLFSYPWGMLWIILWVLSSKTREACQ